MSGPPPALSAATQRKVIKAYRQGETATSIADRLNVHSGTIYRYLSLAKVPRRASTSYTKISVPDKEAKEIVLRYKTDAAETVKTLSKKFSYGVKVIKRLLRGAGLTLRGNRGGDYSVRSDDRDKSLIRSEYKRGASIRSLAKKTGLSSVSVHKIARKLGLRRYEPRPKRQVKDRILDKIYPESAYYIGLLMADGNVHQGRIKLTLDSGDEGEIEKFKLFTGYDGAIEHEVEVNASYIRFTSHHMAETLRFYGVTPNKSLVAVAADELLRNRHFWRGVVDGDGYIAVPTFANTYSRPELGLTGGSPSLLLQYAFYAALILRLSSIPKVVKRKDADNVWDVKLKGPAAVKMAHHLYRRGDVAFQRKMKSSQLI